MVCACRVCTRVCTHARARVCAGVHVCVCACVRMPVRVRMCARAHVCVCSRTSSQLRGHALRFGVCAFARNLEDRVQLGLRHRQCHRLALHTEEQ